jgi:DNA end-binding protein Ku
MLGLGLYEQRDINDAKGVFDDAAAIKTDPEMVKLATQLIDRQTGRYDPTDIEDRYETRLRAMIDAKLKGEGITDEAPVAPPQSNVVDLMAALKRSLGQTDEQPASKAAPAKTKAAKSPSAKAPPKAPPARAPRKRAS